MARRQRREYLLRVAKTAAPLLQAAVSSGNATLVEHIFATLGAVATDDDAVRRLEAVRFDNASVVPLRKRVTSRPLR
jgi:hypothetical protein